MAKVIEKAPRIKGGRQAPTRSYKERLGLVGEGDLAYADKAKISVGRTFLIRADGGSGEPHRLSDTEEKGRCKIPTGDKAYVHHLSRFKDMMERRLISLNF